MKKQSEVVQYLREQAIWISLLADQIESGEPVDCSWCVDLEIPEYQAEVVVIHEQAKLNHELNKAAEGKIA